MIIGFDVSQTGKAKAGCGFFSDNLIRHLAIIDSNNQYFLYPTFGNHFWDDHFQDTCKINQSNFKQGLFHKNLSDAALFWSTSSATEIEQKLGSANILHTNNFFCPTQLQKAKLVYTLFDLSFLEYPDCTTEHNRIACLDGVFNASLFADFIICISEYSRQHFLQYFPHYPENRTAVVHLASRFENQKQFSTPSPHLEKYQPQKFWLHVGTLEPRKNIKRLLRAFSKLVKQQTSPYPLLLAGNPGWLEENIEVFIKDLGLQPYVHLLGYMETNDLQWLYQNCFSCIYPSLFEGFGLPVLEAMSLGAPVICSNSSSLPEISGDSTLLIDPHDEEAILQALLRLVNDSAYREKLKILGQNQAKKFSWEKTARTVLNLYQKVVNEPKYTPTI